MSRRDNRLAEFGNFSYSFKDRVLRRDGASVPLPAKTIDVLEYLILNRDHVVSRQELIAKVWNGISIEDNTVDYQIRVLRSALGTLPGGAPYIRNKRGEGWQFVADVREVLVQEEFQLKAEVIAEAPPATTAPVLSRPEPPESAPPEAESHRARTRQRFVWVATVLGAVGALAASVVPSQKATVDAYVPLTNDGRPKEGPIRATRSAVYFNEVRQGVMRIVSIPTTGGDPQVVPLPPNATLQDISPEGSKLLYLTRDPSGISSAWVYDLHSQTSHLLRLKVDKAEWDGKDAISFLSDGVLSVENTVSHASMAILPIKGAFPSLTWSRDGDDLRYSVADLSRGQFSLWDFEMNHKRLRFIRGGEKVLDEVDWAHDGDLFFYVAGDETRRDIWVDHRTGLGGMFTASSKLTNAPGWWGWPAQGSDRSILYSLRDERRQALVRFDSHANHWEDMWEGSSAFEVDYSPDRSWVAWVDQRDHTIWKSRPDGTSRTQLTRSGRDVHQPHWSRDGKRIAFVGQNANGDYRIFVVSADGGPAFEVQPVGEDQGVPTWSLDDTRLLFGERLGHRAPGAMRLHALNLTTRRVEDLEGTEGLWSPRWAPDGTLMLAVTTDNEKIRVSSPDACHWKDLTSMHFVDNVTWSYDSQFIYFNGRLQPGSDFHLYRVSVHGGKLQDLVDLRNFPIPRENWWGVTPDGSLLGSEDHPLQEIYALKCTLPGGLF